MQHIRRSISIALVALLGAFVVPALAADPPGATPATSGSVPAGEGSIHAEMAAEMSAELAADPGRLHLAFRPGSRPEPLRQAGTMDPLAAAGGLPNGLSRVVLGYLPYWAVTSELLPSMNYDRVSTIAYFGLAARSDGTLTRSGTTWSAWASSLMTDVINRAHAEGVKVVLTVTMMAWDGNYTSMSALLNSPSLRTALANEIATTVSARNADGVNLDFEPMPNSLQTAYTAFVRDVRTALGPAAELSVAVTGGAASWDEGYDLPALVADGAADAIMAMGYDLNWSGSTHAGGVAPIVSPYALDVDTAMADFLDAVPASRLIWGVPYYGRAWTTTGDELNGRTCKSTGTCTVASWAIPYNSARTGAEANGRRWDPAGQVAWYTYASETYDAQVQAYYDDPQSLDVKYDLVNQHELRGVGIWHLLMDAGRYELWNTIGQNLLALPFTDIDDSLHWQAIVWLSEQGISAGCGDGRFCPTAPVKRDEMASFLFRAFGLPDTSIDHFSDDAGNMHELNINRVASAGITVGCEADRYCPSRSVTRAEMASFLVRVLHLPPAATDHFDDDAGSVHEAAINALAESGITTGCTPTSFCPNAPVLREQMAAFLQRALAS